MKHRPNEKREETSMNFNEKSEAAHVEDECNSKTTGVEPPLGNL
ncbi:hypothetical protein [Pseudomonas moorei]|nr:hypothetical protein [Pseudomonas moorei]